MSEKINSTNYDPAERRQAKADKQRVEAWEGEDPSSETFDDLESYFASRPENNEENAKYEDSLDKTLSQAEQGEYKDRFDQIIQDSRELRFVTMQANNVAKLRSSNLEDLTQSKTLEQVIESLKVAEDMIQERLEKWEKDSDLSKEDKDEVISRIIESTIDEEVSEDRDPTNRTVITPDPVEDVAESAEDDINNGELAVEHDDSDNHTEDNEEVEEVDGEIVDDEENENEDTSNDEAEVVDADAETPEFTAVNSGELVPYEEPSLWKKLRNKYYGGFGRLHSRFMEYQKGKKGVFAAGAVLGAGAMYLVYKGFIDTDSANTISGSEVHAGGGIDGSSIDTSVAAPNGHEVAGANEVGPNFSDAARHIDSGEGFYQTFQDMHIPESEWTNLLDKVGPRLQEQGLAYPMDGGSWGINMTPSGKMPDSALRVIENARVSR